MSGPRTAGEWRGVAWGWVLWVECLRWIGRWPVYAGMAVMATIYLAIAGDARRDVLARARRLRPELGRIGRLLLTWRTFFAFAIAIVDRFELLVRGPGAFHYRRNGLRQAMDQVTDRGILLLTAHFGNPDLTAGVLDDGTLGRRLATMRYVAPGDPSVALAERYAPGKMPEIIGPFDMAFAGRAGRDAQVATEARQFAAWLDREVRRNPEQYYEFR